MKEEAAFQLARDVSNMTMNILMRETGKKFPEKARARTFLKTLKEWFNIEQIWGNLNDREKSLFFEFLSPEDIVELQGCGFDFQSLFDKT